MTSEAFSHKVGVLDLQYKIADSKFVPVLMRSQALVLPSIGLI